MGDACTIELEERWQEAGRLMRRLFPREFEMWIAAVERASAEMPKSRAHIDDSYSEP